MQEFFVVTNSFAAPFCSDTDASYIEADTAKDALEEVVANYKHPAGLYAAYAYTSSDAKNKGEEPLSKWTCNHEYEKDRITRSLDGYSYMGMGVGKFEVNGEHYVIENPRQGAVR